MGSNETVLFVNYMISLVVRIRDKNVSVHEFQANSSSAFRQYSEWLITRGIHILYGNSVTCIVDSTDKRVMSTERWPFSEILSHTYHIPYTIYHIRIILCTISSCRRRRIRFIGKPPPKECFFAFKPFPVEKFTSLRSVGLNNSSHQHIIIILYNRIFLEWY